MAQPHAFLPEAVETAGEIRRLVASYPLSSINQQRAFPDTGAAVGRRLNRSGGDMEPSRPWQTGDDTSRIDWNATTRQDKIHVKVFTETRNNNRNSS